MPRATPAFPTFDEWQKLSEREQDVLLDRFECAQRRSETMNWLLSMAGLVAVFAVGGALLVF